MPRSITTATKMNMFTPKHTRAEY